MDQKVSDPQSYIKNAKVNRPNTAQMPLKKYPNISSV